MIRSKKAIRILKAISRINTCILLLTCDETADDETIELVTNFENTKQVLKEKLELQLQKFE